MLRENRWLILGIGGMLLLPLVVSILAFTTLARTAPDALVVEPDLVVTPSPNYSATPYNPNEPYRAGIAAYQAGEYGQAESYLREAIVLAPNEADIYNSLGLVLMEQNRLLPHRCSSQRPLH